MKFLISVTAWAARKHKYYILDFGVCLFFFPLKETLSYCFMWDNDFVENTFYIYCRKWFCIKEKSENSCGGEHYPCITSTPKTHTCLHWQWQELTFVQWKSWNRQTAGSRYLCFVLTWSKWTLPRKCTRSNSVSQKKQGGVALASGWHKKILTFY